SDALFAPFTLFFFFQAEDGIRDFHVTGVQTCALPISRTVRTSPVEAFATRRIACLWSRDELMNARCDASGYHCTSRNVLPSATRSEERRVGKEGECRRPRVESANVVKML